ncbi:hypothetical protein GCM10025859_67720 [Alicyclobacillus fastidiosus]|nr:hypothetical protein GCM10025859_67230 [Alicyclobacillus fastidiosus]GMA66330.1 hypothetical protein GCM10025859_67720 [Alicyclobacillus fastidiosus]
MSYWDLIFFFRRLSLGTYVTIQYDSRPPATGVFQGFQGGAVLLSRFDGFPGLTRLNINRINAASV